MLEVIQEWHGFAGDLASVPPPEKEPPVTLVTQKRRFVLTALGLFHRMEELVGETEEIRSTSQGADLVTALHEAVDYFVSLLG